MLRLLAIRKFSILGYAKEGKKRLGPQLDTRVYQMFKKFVGQNRKFSQFSKKVITGFTWVTHFV
jgi:hypothetical protein